jgi:hypothetical protein
VGWHGWHDWLAGKKENSKPFSLYKGILKFKFTLKNSLPASQRALLWYIQFILSFKKLATCPLARELSEGYFNRKVFSLLNTLSLHQTDPRRGPNTRQI